MVKPNGRPPKITPKQREYIRDLFHHQASVTKIARKFSLSTAHVYRICRG